MPFALASRSIFWAVSNSLANSPLKGSASGPCVFRNLRRPTPSCPLHSFCDRHNVLRIGWLAVLVVFDKSRAARQLSLKLLPCPIPIHDAFHTSIVSKFHCPEGHGWCFRFRALKSEITKTKRSRSPSPPRMPKALAYTQRLGARTCGNLRPIRFLAIGASCSPLRLPPVPCGKFGVPVVPLQVPPHKSPKEGTDDHAKSRFSITAIRRRRFSQPADRARRSGS